MAEWSNNACLGYTIRALEELGYSEEEIKKITGEMKYLFDIKTIEEAEKVYCKSQY